MNKYLEKISKASSLNTNQIRSYLNKVKSEMDSHGLEYFVVASTPGTNHGASIYDNKGVPDGAASNARKAHTKWEESRGISSKHDWSSMFAHNLK